MATFNAVRNTQIPISRGTLDVRVYDNLSVDFIVHSMVRIAVHGRKARTAPQRYPINRKLSLPLTQRSIAKEE